MSSKRRVLLRVLAGGALLLALTAVALMRPWSSRNSWRQMRIFSPGVRVENFRTMADLFPAHELRRSRTPHHFRVEPRALPESYSFAGRQERLDGLLDRTVTTGLLVLVGDAIVSERYFRGATESSPLTSWSVAKSVVSLLVGIARSEGHLADLDAPLERYSPALAGSGYGRVPLRAALTMSSGIRFGEAYDDPLSDVHTLFARIFYLREGAAHYLASLPAEAPAGSRFHYASSDTFAVGLSLRDAIGKPLTTYLQERLWEPLGMEHDASWNAENEDGLELGFCCLNVSLRDYAKIGRLVARGGDWDGRQLVDAAWIRESTRVEAARRPGMLAEHAWGYQYQWWIPNASREAVMAAGVWGQFIYIDPTKQVVIVKTSVDPDFALHGDESVAMFEAIADAT